MKLQSEDLLPATPDGMSPLRFRNWDRAGASEMASAQQSMANPVDALRQRNTCPSYPQLAGLRTQKSSCLQHLLP
jgi:hypothetical protein